MASKDVTEPGGHSQSTSAGLSTVSRPKPTSKQVTVTVPLCEPDLSKIASKVEDRAVFVANEPCKECSQVSNSKDKNGKLIQAVYTCYVARGVGSCLRCSVKKVRCGITVVGNTGDEICDDLRRELNLFPANEKTTSEHAFSLSSPLLLMPATTKSTAVARATADSRSQRTDETFASPSPSPTPPPPVKTHRPSFLQRDRGTDGTRKQGPNPSPHNPLTNAFGPSLQIGKRGHAMFGEEAVPSKKVRRAPAPARDAMPVDRVVVELDKMKQAVAAVGTNATLGVKGDIIRHAFDPVDMDDVVAGAADVAALAETATLSTTTRQWIANRLEYFNANLASMINLNRQQYMEQKRLIEYFRSSNPADLNKIPSTTI